MREIKFRAKSGTQWRYGDLYHNERGELVIYEPKTSGRTLEGKAVYGWRIKVDPETVGQFTGLKDTDGREIYEGDVLNNLYGHLGVSYKQEWAAFVACGVDSTGYYHEYLLDEIINTLVRREEIKVIGNIHDDPELLERKS